MSFCYFRLHCISDNPCFEKREFLKPRIKNEL